MFDRILIANRGEIACRIIATCRRLGVSTVAVYSEADRNARHVRLADAAVHIGAAEAHASYLNTERLLEAAHRSGAQAVHPGYGFLAENAEFARACAEAGLVFIGPPPAAIEAMGDKRQAKTRMQAAGVPVTPGYHGDNQDAPFLAEQAANIGYPVLIKASAGGGGKGMRLVEHANAFAAALQACQREAAAAFGDDKVLLERYITQPRHVEIQVFGDAHGHCVHLFERDCSMQRRHQKVLEEAPAPGLSDAQREAMAQAAMTAARAVEYVGAGTVEFILGADGAFHFMEMNTRLQVEHPVTEMITGIDLVEWQLRVAAGQPLPLTQEQISARGHAMEARLYAEDALNGFLPSTGTLNTLRFPPASAHLRIDTGVDEGDAISPWYDPMIAKLIVWDDTRAAALARLRQALDALQVAGVTTNAVFLARLARDADFSAARLDTGLIAREHERLLAPLPAPSDADWRHAALAVLLQSRNRPGHDPWQADDGWRLCGHAPRRVELASGTVQRRVSITCLDDGYSIGLEDEPQVHLRAHLHDGVLLLERGGLRERIGTVVDGAHITLYRSNAIQHTFTQIDPLRRTRDTAPHAGSLTAPMPGRIVALLADPGTRVARGTALLVMEAMKMEHTLQAPHAGNVRAFLVQPGELVTGGAVLVDFMADDEAAASAS